MATSGPICRGGKFCGDYQRQSRLIILHPIYRRAEAWIFIQKEESHGSVFPLVKEEKSRVGGGKLSPPHTKGCFCTGGCKKIQPPFGGNLLWRTLVFNFGFLKKGGFDPPLFKIKGGVLEIFLGDFF